LAAERSLPGGAARYARARPVLRSICTSSWAVAND
jgi:hypothetical protein